MNRRFILIRNIAIGLVGLVLIIAIAAILVVQTRWFRDYVKEKIVTSTEASTGGKVNVGSFSFDWKHLRAMVTDFVIHGDEPAGSAPFLRANRVQVDIRLFTSIHHVWDIAYLNIDRPEANIIVFSDNRTNIPRPKERSTESQPLVTVVNLSIGHFDLRDGRLVFASQTQHVSVSGSNLRTELWYNVLKQGYQGQISFQPVYVVSGRNTPVQVAVSLPVALQGDRIDVQNGKITTAKTSLDVSGSVENLRNPKLSAHIKGRLAMADLKNAANLPLALDARDIPADLHLDANAVVANDTIQVTGLRLGLGNSSVEASGTLKDPSGKGELEFRSRIALGELGRLTKVAARPDGTVLLNGTAKLDASNNYQVQGNLVAKHLSFSQASQMIQDVDLTSSLRLDPHLLELHGMRLAAFGGEFGGDASLQDFARYRVRGNVRNLSLRAAARALGEKQLPYDGTISGPLQADGDLQAASATKGLAGHIQLSIAPGHQGIPVSGRLYAEYNGSADRLSIQNSYLALPHTRLTLNGSLPSQLNITLSTSDSNDLLAATSLTGKSPINLNDKQASFTGRVTGSLSAPQIAGRLAADGFSVEGRLFDSLTADLDASSRSASVRSGSLRRGSMDTEFSGQIGLSNWKTTPHATLTADAIVQNGDLADIMALAGQPSTDYSGALSATLHVGGTVADPQGAVNVLAQNGTIQGESFDRIEAKANLSDQFVSIPAAFIQAGSARVNLTADYQHSRVSFTAGRLHAHVQSTPVDLAQLRNLQKQRPNTAGTMQLNADVSGNFSEAKANGKLEFLLTSVNGDASGRGLRLDGENYGDFNANARTSGQTVSYNVTSDFAGSNIRLSGNTQLVRDYPSNIDANIERLPVERVLAAAKRTDIPVKGNLGGSVQLSGTVDNPQGSGNLELANAVLYDEPLDRVRLRAAYGAHRLDVSQLEAVEGASRIDLTARYEHAEHDVQSGRLQFRLNNSRVDLARIKNVQSRRPGLGGTLQLTADGAVEVGRSEPRLLVQDLNANLSGTRILAQGKNYGDLTLTTKTTAGKLDFALDSNLAGSSIHGRGNAQLAESYPLEAQLTFSNVTWTRLEGLIGPPSSEPSRFEITSDGQVTVRGPALKYEELRGSFELSRLQMTTLPERNAGSKPVVIQNQGPIRASLDRQIIRVESAHVAGPQTDIQAAGTVSLQQQTMELTVNGTANLALLQNFDRDITSSGNIVLAGTIRGDFNKPLLNGQLELRNASLNYAPIPNGISNANGIVIFNGNSASIRNMTGESGGGKITMAGFVAYRDEFRFGLRADASGVRVRPAAGASVVADANVRLTGTAENSTLSGTATIQRLAYAPQTDIAAVLSTATPPFQSAAPPSPIADNMKLDIHVRTSEATSVQSSIAENLQMQADLRVRGTVSHPGMLGRVSITEGKLTFFGANYTVNSGSIGFYNPVRIEPLLDLNLETKSKGVDVSLRVTGPIDNLKLSYTSDPPLQFEEIVSLLAAGRVPTSDPTLLANQPSQPPQSYQQMGETALMGKALADPVANRLQRVFGVTQLKIDPTLTNGSQLPQAQLSLQQQVADNITFTYVTALDSANAQIISVEFALNRQWSATAMRDQNGIFSVNLIYKKQFR